MSDAQDAILLSRTSGLLNLVMGTTTNKHKTPRGQGEGEAGDSETLFNERKELSPRTETAPLAGTMESYAILSITST